MPVKPTNRTRISSTSTQRRTRRRLTAQQARAAILSAAADKLTRVGPERLRLNELAAELGITHQAILHHFGSREDLVSAVLAQAVAHSTRELSEVVARGGARASHAALDLVQALFGAQGRARLLAWLVLSERAGELHALARSERPLSALLALVHKQRQRARPGLKVSRKDSRFVCELGACALLGEALFGELLRASFGGRVGPSASREFQTRLGRLLAYHE